MGCDLTTTQALSDASFLVSETKLVNFRAATFTTVTFVGEFDQLQVDGAKLDGVNAEAAHFSRCDFGHAVLTNSHFTQSSFTDCWFGGASILDCDFSRAVIRGCNFEDGVLEKLALVEADLSENDLRQARLADLCLAHGRYMNLNNQQLINELDRAELDDERYLGASFYFTGGPLPGRAEIEWSDDLEQNLWVVRC
ncbi:MAG: pentapeptide repeat-containing protein [Cyanothece sp. SIO1E1]|nr:pentapeptide repeat-containing protein [Cyanothece sp. SIO1E1]